METRLARNVRAKLRMTVREDRGLELLTWCTKCHPSSPTRGETWVEVELTEDGVFVETVFMDANGKRWVKSWPQFKLKQDTEKPAI
jgi:hypothetical protein